MATLTVQSSTVQTGTVLTYNTANATTDSFANDGRTFAIIKNSSGANAYTVTISAPGLYKGRTITAPTATVAVSSAGVVIGPFDAEIHNNSSGQATLTYSGSAPATDLKVAVFTS